MSIIIIIIIIMITERGIPTKIYTFHQHRLHVLSYIVNTFIICLYCKENAAYSVFTAEKDISSCADA